MKTWQEIINKEKNEKYFQNLNKEIDLKYETSKVFPEKDKIYNAFCKTSLDDLKVVILGQDPYHGEGQAQGLSFSTPSTIKNPPSMKNILKEIYDDLKKPSLCLDGDLTPWAKEGVLLLNTILTVEEGKAKSHHKLGWEVFTDNIIKYISHNCKDVIFLLWGSSSISKSKFIDETRHYILTAAHPSPLSSYRGFFGCKHFSKTNEILASLNKKQINW